MRNLFLIGFTTITILASGSAFSADLRMKSAAPATMRAGCAQFGGGYIGASGGWANLSSNWVDRDAWVDNFSNDWALGTVNNNDGNITLGGQIGYNFQSGCTDGV